MARIYQYPINVESEDLPFALFTKHRATYNKSKTSVGLHTDSHVSLYMPMGLAFNDNMQYETAATGLVGAAYENGINPENYNKSDLQAAINSYGAAAAGAGAASVGALGNIPVIGSLIGGGGVAAATSAIIQEEQRKNQISLNPREFMLFKAPGMRNFSFRFRFIPDSKEESDQVLSIIKFFRTGMYPTVNGAFSYSFPDAFQIEFKKIEGVPKLPELYLESASTTYNPNSLSYFKHNNRPVEINLSLEFKELQPISRSEIEGGF